MKIGKSRGLRYGAAGLALAGVVAGTATAATVQERASSRQTITVCVGSQLNHLRLVPNSTTRCAKGEKLLTWRATGKRGKQGPAGADGDDGASAYQLATAAGFTGSQEQWLESLRGLTGKDGATGANGRDGVDGAPGRDGATGLTGDTGAAGADGQDGQDGADGADGADGLTAYQIAVSYGYVGDEADWLDSLQGLPGADGRDGLSAYDIAVSQGYVGTEAAWLASLKGADGRDGAPGADGAPGPAGAPGAAGADGEQGAQGIQGIQGLQGLQGPAGPPGPQGERGATGAAGPAGERGPAGVQGERGPAGQTGAAGPAGPAGVGARQVYDGQNRLLGTVDSMWRDGLEVLTSTGHLITVGWDGTLYPAQVYYTRADCTGDVLLNAGGPTESEIYAKTVVYLGTPNRLAVPDVPAGAVSAPSSQMTAAAIDNPRCGTSSGTKHGWRLRNTDPSEVGLPPMTGTGRFAAPLRLS